MNRLRFLHALYERERLVPFAWGTADCLAFCGASDLLLTGTDPTEQLRAQYDSEISARRVMAARGWASLHDVARSFHEEIPLALAQPGDWAFVVNEDKTETLGVVIGSMIAARAATSLGQVPRSYARFAYRAG